ATRGSVVPVSPRPRSRCATYGVTPGPTAHASRRRGPELGGRPVRLPARPSPGPARAPRIRGGFQRLLRPSPAGGPVARPRSTSFAKDNHRNSGVEVASGAPPTQGNPLLRTQSLPRTPGHPTGRLAIPPVSALTGSCTTTSRCSPANKEPSGVSELSLCDANLARGRLLPWARHQR